MAEARIDNQVAFYRDSIDIIKVSSMQVPKTGKAKQERVKKATRIFGHWREFGHAQLSSRQNGRNNTTNASALLRDENIVHNYCSHDS